MRAIVSPVFSPWVPGWQLNRRDFGHLIILLGPIEIASFYGPETYRGCVYWVVSRPTRTNVRGLLDSDLGTCCRPSARSNDPSTCANRPFPVKLNPKQL